MRALRSNPWLVIAAAAVVGWLLGSGVFKVPLALPIGPHPTSPAKPTAPATLPASSAAGAPVATSSASMPGPATTSDPFAGYNL